MQRRTSCSRCSPGEPTVMNLCDSRQSNLFMSRSPSTRNLEAACTRRRTHVKVSKRHSLQS